MKKGPERQLCPLITQIMKKLEKKNSIFPKLPTVLDATLYIPAWRIQLRARKGLKMIRYSYSLKYANFNGRLLCYWIQKTYGSKWNYVCIPAGSKDIALALGFICSQSVNSRIIFLWKRPPIFIEWTLNSICIRIEILGTS